MNDVVGKKRMKKTNLKIKTKENGCTWKCMRLMKKKSENETTVYACYLQNILNAHSIMAFHSAEQESAAENKIASDSVLQCVCLCV